MYTSIKHIAKKVLPSRILRKYESLFRQLIAFRYRGDKYICNVCDYKLARFVIIKNQNKLCPKCGSLSRTRRLWSIIKDEVAEKTILHFSPPYSLSQKIDKHHPTLYVTTDYEGEFRADKALNIEDIDEPNNTYDLILCYHVLEHILNDIQAMRELFRILKPQGVCIIQTPFKDGEIYEDVTIVSPKERLQHFGQEDHVRIYSVQSLEQRLQSVGFDVHIRHYKESENNKNGFESSEYIFVAKKE